MSQFNFPFVGFLTIFCSSFCFLIQVQADAPKGLTKDQIENTVKSHQQELRFCEEKSVLSKENPNGDLKVQFIILPTGALKDVKRMEPSSLNAKGLQDCVIGKILKWTFPKSGKGVEEIVEYSFNFHTSPPPTLAPPAGTPPAPAAASTTIQGPTKQNIKDSLFGGKKLNLFGK